jgi:hypothetical protein
MSAYKLDPDQLEQYQYAIFEVCEKLHMSKTGSGDRIGDEERGKYVAALSKRICNWRTDVRTETYDNAVKALIIATIKEQIE